MISLRGAAVKPAGEVRAGRAPSVPEERPGPEGATAGAAPAPEAIATAALRLFLEQGGGRGGWRITAAGPRPQGQLLHAIQGQGRRGRRVVELNCVCDAFGKLRGLRLRAAWRSLAPSRRRSTPRFRRRPWAALMDISSVARVYPGVARSPAFGARRPIAALQALRCAMVPRSPYGAHGLLRPVDPEVSARRRCSGWWEAIPLPHARGARSAAGGRSPRRSSWCSAMSRRAVVIEPPGHDGLRRTRARARVVTFAPEATGANGASMVTVTGPRASAKSRCSTSSARHRAAGFRARGAGAWRHAAYAPFRPDRRAGSPGCAPATRRTSLARRPRRPRPAGRRAARRGPARATRSTTATTEAAIRFTEAVARLFRRGGLAAPGARAPARLVAGR